MDLSVLASLLGCLLVLGVVSSILWKSILIAGGFLSENLDWLENPLFLDFEAVV